MVFFRKRGFYCPPAGDGRTIFPGRQHLKSAGPVARIRGRLTKNDIPHQQGSVIMETMVWTLFESPFGRIWLSSTGKELTGLRFVSGEELAMLEKHGRYSSTPFGEATRQLKAYFRGELRRFEIPIRLEGTPFQKAAWRELRKIPYGTTITYGEQAARMGNPKACRAAGAADRGNPISIIVPCHRVIGKNGKLTGFGGGRKMLDLKAELLTLEKVTGFRF